jgi:hypothetical protein
MNENEPSIQRNVEHEHRKSSKLIHHSYVFWIFVLLMLACITYYIVSINFTYAPAPQSQYKQPSENSQTP